MAAAAEAAVVAEEQEAEAHPEGKEGEDTKRSAASPHVHQAAP